MRRVEIGPEHVEKDELRIGGLPEQEIRQPLLPRGAQDQVWVGHSVGAEEAGEGGFIEGSGIQRAGLRRLCDRLGRHDNFRPRPIGQRDGQVQLRSARRRFLGRADGAGKLGAEALMLADHAQPDAFLGQRRDGMEQIKAAEKKHEVAEDEGKRWHDEVQKLTDQYTKKVDEVLVEKEKDIKTV